MLCKNTMNHTIEKKKTPHLTMIQKLFTCDLILCIMMVKLTDLGDPYNINYMNGVISKN